MIAGGSGLIGSHVSAALIARGDEVLVLSRHPASVQAHLPGCAVLPWHPGSDGKWQAELDVVDAVVDLSGAPFFTRWRGDYYKREVLGSRRTAIQSLIDAIARASVRPTVFVSTFSLGPYGFRRDDEVLTERSRPDIGPLSRDALELEACALKAEALGTRVVLLRPGSVLAPDGGALQLMTRAFARGLGAPVAPGTHWCSWIQIADAVELIISALEHEHAQGPLNLTSPNPVGNREFAQAFAEATSRPLRSPIPGEHRTSCSGRPRSSSPTGSACFPPKHSSSDTSSATRGVRAKVLLCHGAIDPHVPTKQVTEFIEEMNGAQADYQLIVYGGAMHGFTHDVGPQGPGVAYHPVSDKRSFQAIKAFLAEVFGTEVMSATSEGPNG